MMVRPRPNPITTRPRNELTRAQISQIRVPAENIVVSQTALA